MSRLTKKYDGGDVEVIGNEYKAFQKLSNLEDLEQDLGCPLDVVFKALKDKEIIVKHTIGFPSQVNNLKTHRISGLQFNGTNFIIWLYDILCSSEFSVELKDYKKTWWLKEDLSE